MAKAEIIRSEAQKHLLDLNASQHLTREQYSAEWSEPGSRRYNQANRAPTGVGPGRV